VGRGRGWDVRGGGGRATALVDGVKDEDLLGSAETVPLTRKEIETTVHPRVVTGERVGGGGGV